MNLTRFTSIAAAVLLVGGLAQAEPIVIDVPENVPVPVSTVTRAEVVADYQIWRLAGLEALQRGDAGPDIGSDEYKQAQAKYQVLRASPQFAALVKQIEQDPFATVLAGKPAGDAVASSGHGSTH